VRADRPNGLTARHVIQAIVHLGDIITEWNQRREEQVERCRREVEACRSAGADPKLTPAEKLGALQGEVDWLVALQMAEEESS
jgi:hypothetical protein